MMQRVVMRGGGRLQVLDQGERVRPLDYVLPEPESAGNVFVNDVPSRSLNETIRILSVRLTNELNEMAKSTSKKELAAAMGSLITSDVYGPIVASFTITECLGGMKVVQIEYKNSSTSTLYIPKDTGTA